MDALDKTAVTTRPKPSRFADCHLSACCVSEGCICQQAHADHGDCCKKGFISFLFSEAVPCPIANGLNAAFRGDDQDFQLVKQEEGYGPTDRWQVAKFHAIGKLDFMQQLRRKLPPPNLLITFEAAGRQLSFTKAASELNVSRVAVSQQIQALERFLDIPLFQRLQRSVRLTRAGERYHVAISEALERALRATMEISRRSDTNIVNVGTTPGFMTYWLSPRLGEFRTMHPDIELRFIVSDGNLGFEDNIDIAIRYGSPPFDDAETTFLVRQEISPTCANTFLLADTILEPAELLAYPLIHLEGPYDEHTRWSTWFRAHGLDQARAKAGITVNSYTNLVQAALEGQGFALIGPPLVHRFLLSGMLVQPVNARAVVRHAFHLSLPRLSIPSAAARAFSNWIKGAFLVTTASIEGKIEVERA